MIVKTIALQYSENETQNLVRAAQWAAQALKTLCIQETRSLVVEVFGSSYSECQKLLAGMLSAGDCLTISPTAAKQFVQMLSVLLSHQGLSFDSVPGLLVSSLLKDLASLASSPDETRNERRYCVNE